MKNNKEETPSLVERLRQHLASIKLGFKGPSIVEAYDSPYCSACGGCGEEGCCSPLICKQSGSGDYCSTYLDDLQFGYRMYRDLMKLLDDDENYKQQLDELFEKNYNIIYRKDEK
jgi:hypothetical protein